MEEFVYATFPIFYVLGIVLTVTVPIIMILFWKKIMPSVLRKLFWISRKKLPILLLCHDSGRSIFTSIIERQGEGIVKTKEDKYKILPRFAPKFPLAQLIKQHLQAQKEANLSQSIVKNSATNPETETESEEVTEQSTNQQNGKTVPPDFHSPLDVIPQLDLPQIFNITGLKENFLLDYSDFINKRSTIVGLNLPLFLGYTGKLCLLNPEALALYEAGEMFVRTSEGDIFNPKGIEGKKKEDAMQPLLLLNPRKIQEIIYEGFDQSQVAGIVADTEEEMRLRLGGGGLGGNWKLIILIVIIMLAALGALFFLPQLFGGQAPTAILHSILHR